ncbi:hypothetical protein DK459_29090 [Achromobacter sp. RW408]|nr:hypothetical protein DK459_29090 [Achromobacter sp. RW408]
MLSGVRLSCYQEYENAGKPITARVCALPNIPNLNSLTFSREAPFRWTTAEKQKSPPIRRQEQPQHQPRSARQNHAGFPGRRAAS